MLYIDFYLPYIFGLTLLSSLFSSFSMRLMAVVSFLKHKNVFVELDTIKLYVDQAVK